MANEDPKVGYGKPPKNSQFKKGQSGNPNGRPAKRDGQVIAVDEILNDKVLVKTKQGTRKIDSRELELRTQLAKALKGDVATLCYLTDQFEKYDVLTIPQTPQNHGVVEVPSKIYPMRVCTLALTIYGRPPWSEAQLRPIIEDYVATRSHDEQLHDELKGYKL